MQDKKPVPFVVFTWAIGLVFLMLGWVFTEMKTLTVKVDTAVSSQNEIRVQLSQIQTDLVWIRGVLVDMKGEKT